MKIDKYKNKIINLYLDEYLSCQEIAKKYHCHFESVWSLLKRNNVTLRKKIRRQTIKPKNYGKKSDKYYNGIDRIDNTKDYTLDNCVPCCKNCNYAKRTLTQHDFYKLIQSIYNYRVKNILDKGDNSE